MGQFERTFRSEAKHSINYQVFYSPNSHSGSFWDSDGYAALRKDAYEAQREFARLFVSDDVSVQDDTEDAD